LPGQTILLSRSADDVLRVLVDVIAFPFFESIGLLGLDVTVAELNGIQLIGADATIQKLLPSGFGIEKPFSFFLNQRNRKWPVLFTNQNECTISVLGIHGNALLLSRLSYEIGSVLAILRRFAGGNDVFSIWSKNLRECVDIELLGCSDECVCSLRRRLKPLCQGTTGGSCRHSLGGGVLGRGEQHELRQACAHCKDANRFNE